MMNNILSSETSMTSTIVEGAANVTKYKKWVRVEIVTLSALILIVWCLLSLPVIFFHLPVALDESPMRLGQACSAGIPQTYEHNLCREELEAVQSCFLGDSSNTILIPENIQQDSVVDEIQLLFDGLELLRPSDACKAVVRPFLCLYELGLCDSNGMSYQPTMQQCIEISTVVCASQWRAANSLLGPSRSLPDCNTFTGDSMVCSNNAASASGSESGNNNSFDRNDVQVSADGDLISNCTIKCQDGFYCQPEDNVCNPRCDTWLQYPYSTSVFIDVVVVISAIVGVVSAVAVFVLSCLRHKRMFTFPSIFVIYMTVSLVILASFVLMSYIGRSRLNCSSVDLISSLSHPTVFCALSGAVFYYTLMQLALWWIFHVAALFWKIVYPFHARRLEAHKKIKYIHITMVVVGIFLPFIPVGVTVSKGGFGLTRFPPILCTGTQSEATFYSLILPITLILAAGMTLLIIMFLVIHKQHVLFRARQSSKQPFKMGTAEKKILIIFCYYVILSVIAITAYTLATRNVELFAAEVAKYFVCERFGFDPNEPCNRNIFEKLEFPGVTTISFVLLGFFPAVNLIFAANIKEIKQIISTCCKSKRLFTLVNEASTISSAANSSLSQKNTLKLQNV